MRIVKIILITLAVIIAIPLIAAIFINKEYVVEREIIINKPRQEVFDYVKQLKNQDNYSKWVMADPNMNKTYKGTDGTVGFIYAWDSKDKNVGKGEQEIKEITEGKAIDVEVRFEKPMEGVAHAPIITEAVSENQTKIKWGMRGKCSYPMNFMNLFMDGMLGKDVQSSLVTLKNILEKQ